MKLTDFPQSVQERIRAENPQLAPKAIPVEIPRDGYRSGLERAYAAHLELLKRGGEIVWWAHEPWRLRIAKGKKTAFYKPDFVVKTAGRETEFHETKGFRREAGMLRLKVAAGEYPYRFVLVTRDEGGAWRREVFRDV